MVNLKNYRLCNESANNYVGPDNETLHQETSLDLYFYHNFKHSFRCLREIFNAKMVFLMQNYKVLPKQTADSVNWLHNIILCVLRCV